MALNCRDQIIEFLWFQNCRFITSKWIQASLNKDTVKELGIHSLFQPHTHNFSINQTKGEEEEEKKTSFVAYSLETASRPQNKMGT